VRWNLQCHTPELIFQTDDNQFPNISSLITVPRAERFEFDRGGTCEAAIDDELLVAAIERGSVNVESPLFEGEVNSGQAFVIPGSAGWCRLTACTRGRCLAVTLRGTLTESVMGHNLRDGRIFVPAGLTDVLESTRALENADTPEQVSGTAYSLLMRLHQTCGERRTIEGFPPYLEAALGIINGEYAYIDGVEDIAERVGVTPHHLIRVFSRYVGTTPGRYLKLRRLECARELLTRKGVSVAMAAELSGFSDPNYFAKVFRKETGVSPSEYAAAHMGENAGGEEIKRLIDESYL